ncbi:MAG: hypothetical protein WBG10_01930, partial [Pseudolabrys sp.]
GVRADDANICLGADFDAQRPLIAAKITARPHVYLIKGADDDPACPSLKDVCQEQAYLVPGDIVLSGRTQGAFTCVSYQSFHTRMPDWTNGWLPTSSLSRVAPMRAPKAADWIGSWSHPGGTISISLGTGGKLSIAGEHTYAAKLNVHSGVLGADVQPAQGMIAFAEDGSVPFDQAPDGSCLVRMQRIEAWLLVEDNMECGGAMVTFTGIYRRD